jgi:DNA-binding CsgD family transcriptional regulator
VLVDLTARQLRPLLLQLSERERTILMRRAAGQSLREIGRSLGVSGQRVQTIEGRALAKLRTAASAGVDSQPRMLTSSVAGPVPAGDHTLDRRSDERPSDRARAREPAHPFIGREPDRP